MAVRRRTKRNRDGLIAFVILAPMFLFWLIVSGFPTLFGFFLGFFD